MSTHVVYSNDLLHRYSGYSFTESTDDSIITVSFLDGSSNIVAAGNGLTLIDAYRKVRSDVLDGEDPLFLSTSTERDALTDIDAGLTIFNLTSEEDETFDGSDWISAGGEDGGIIHVPGATVDTDGNTQTTCIAFTLDSDTSYLFTADVIGETSGHTIVAGFNIECVAKREGSGSAELVGSVTTVHSGKDTGSASWSATFTVSGNDLRVSVTGQNSTTVAWEATLSYTHH